MRVWKIISALILFELVGSSRALEPNQILIIANSDSDESTQVAQYYCQKRNVPKKNILALPVGKALREEISREDYVRELAKPIRERLLSSEFAGRIRCLLTIYGVPIKVGGRQALGGLNHQLRQLQERKGRTQREIELLDLSKSAFSDYKRKKLKRDLLILNSRIEIILGRETNASVDSELSMVLFGEYELYKWQPNKLSYKMPYWDFKTLMVSRLDGPGFKIARTLVDKSINAEKKGLRGIVYIDSGYSVAKTLKSLYQEYDISLQELAELAASRTKMPVIEDKTEAVFGIGKCPKAAIYCGWYSLGKYVDAFDFVDGAIGYHVASLEAVNLRDPDSTQWCPAMLKDGVTATLGAVDEPYLAAFPKPKEFFTELFNGYSLVEAYYRTKPFNSWRLVLIGDPLYRPFKTGS